MISAKCTTYGRVSFLEEALFSFINQDDIGDSELIIVNDCPFQHLEYEHPNVKIFNVEKQFLTIGEKDNFAIEQSKGDIIATWDDDDIAMSNHLNNIRKYFDSDADILHWVGVFFDAEIKAIGGVGNSGMVYSRKAWEKVGKHPIMNAGGDTVFSDKIHEYGKILNIYPEEVSWWYRWGVEDNKGVGVYHQSGMGTDTPDRVNVVLRHAAYIEGLRKKKLIPEGIIKLNPHWRKDYKNELINFLQNVDKKK